MIDGLIEMFQKMQREIAELEKDVKTMEIAVLKDKKAESDDPNKVPVKPSIPVLHPMTRIRKDMQEIKKASDSPQITVIEDKIKDFLG